MDQDNQELGDALQLVRELSVKGSFREALELADSLCREYPHDWHAAYERANLIVAHMPPFDGLAAAKGFAQRFPESCYGPVLLACANLNMKRGKEAVRQLEAASKLGAPEGTVLGLRVRALELIGRREEALRLAAAGTDLERMQSKFRLKCPKDPSQLDAALEEMRLAGETAENLALCKSGWYLERGIFAEAADCLQAALSSSGPSDMLSLQLAKAEFRLGKKDAALQRLSDILAEHPENLQVRGSFMWFSFFRGRFISFLANYYQLFRYSLGVDPSGPKKNS
jgi:tetratricopeptide (TPR) repeat protein